MRILYLGSGEFAVPSFRSILGDGHEIVAAVTQPDKVRGRGRKTSPTPLKSEALEHGVTVLAPADVNAADVVDQIKSLRADLAFVAAFGQKIGAQLLEMFPAGIVNLHGSVLPALRGAGPIQWAIINGLRETGVTVFRIVEKMDAGPVIIQRRTAIGNQETADELHDRLARIGCDATREALRALEADQSLPGTPQDPAQVTRAPKLKKEHSRIALDEPVEALARRIRGLWSWPGAKCWFQTADGSRREAVTLARAVPYEGQVTPAASAAAIGRLTEVLAVQGIDRELAILEIKPANGKLQTWRDFVNGRHVRPGDRFLPYESD